MLQGGNISAVELRDGRVHRSSGPWSATVQALLRHARSNGVAWVPEPFGFDEQGREVLQFLPGEVPHAMPPWIWSESVLHDVARALRVWHDVAADFPREGAIWRFPSSAPPETICHNDFAPYNCVFREGHFFGAIDFDFSAPGPRTRDLAWAAYRFVPLQPSAGSDVADGGGERSPFDPEATRHRLESFLDTYAEHRSSIRPDTGTFLGCVAERLDEVAAWTRQHVAGDPESPLVGHARMYRAHADWLRSGGLSTP